MTCILPTHDIKRPFIHKPLFHPLKWGSFYFVVKTGLSADTTRKCRMAKKNSEKLCSGRLASERLPKDQKTLITRQLIQDTRGSIKDGAATLRHKWRSLPEEGPPHVKLNTIKSQFEIYF